ncbi:hypothetical protein V2W45_110323 [Cenococcum geophilum]
MSKPEDYDAMHFCSLPRIFQTTKVSDHAKTSPLYLSFPEVNKQYKGNSKRQDIGTDGFVGLERHISKDSSRLRRRNRSRIFGHSKLTLANGDLPKPSFSELRPASRLLLGMSKGNRLSISQLKVQEP